MEKELIDNAREKGTDPVALSIQALEMTTFKKFTPEHLNPPLERAIR